MLENYDDLIAMDCRFSELPDSPKVRDLEKRARRQHRKISAMLAHELSSKVIHSANRPQLEATRDKLCEMLGIDPLRQDAIEYASLRSGEVVVVDEDGEFSFGSRMDFNLDKLEHHMVASGIYPDPRTE